MPVGPVDGVSEVGRVRPVPVLGALLPLKMGPVKAGNPLRLLQEAQFLLDPLPFQARLRDE